MIRGRISWTEAGCQVPSFAKYTPRYLASWHITGSSREQMAADDESEKNSGIENYPGAFVPFSL